jgi:hypothetical protein
LREKKRKVIQKNGWIKERIQKIKVRGLMLFMNMSKWMD